jgi:hypothetical protein
MFITITILTKITALYLKLKVTTMKNMNYVIATCWALVSMATFIGCEKPENNDGADIVYQSVNKNYIMKPDLQAMNSHDSTIAQHVDSILNGLIETELVSTGFIRFDLDDDEMSDFAFEIVDLQPLNNNELPQEFDSLAVRSYPVGGSILDNSTFKYADALDAEVLISSAGNWTDDFVVLGTFMNSGQFNGKGEKYLAVRLPGVNDYRYGWMKIYISEHNDTLRVIEYAYNKIEGSQLRAGQRE